MIKQFAIAALLMTAVAFPVAPAEAGILKTVARAVVLKTLVPAECKVRKALHKPTGILCN
jgi:hypothetical protein